MSKKVKTDRIYGVKLTEEQMAELARGFNNADPKVLKDVLDKLQKDTDTFPPKKGGEHRDPRRAAGIFDERDIKRLIDLAAYELDVYGDLMKMLRKADKKGFTIEVGKTTYDVECYQPFAPVIGSTEQAITQMKLWLTKGLGILAEAHYKRGLNALILVDEIKRKGSVNINELRKTNAKNNEEKKKEEEKKKKEEKKDE